MKTLILIVASILFVTVGCKKDYEQGCRGRDYTLEHPMTVYPIKESYDVGDTIWIEMNFPDVFTLRYPNLQNTNEYFTTTAKLVDFDFHRNFIKIYELSDTNLPFDVQPYAWESFQFELITGNVLYMVEGGLVYKLKYENNMYKLNGFLICEQSGTFLLNLYFRRNYPNSSFGANEQDITPECNTTETIYDIEFPINRQNDGTYLTNYHIFEQYMNPALETDLDLVKNRCFTFKVN